MQDADRPPPTEEELEAVLAALLQVDPEGISGKHDAKKGKADPDERDPR